MAIAGAGGAAVSAIGSEDDGARRAGAVLRDEGGARRASAVLRDADGQRVGRVEFRQRRGAVRVRVRARDLPPGFHGFHVHAVGRCQPPGFTTAGGHLKREGQEHRDHAGDLPVLLVNRDGTGRLVTVTDRFSLRDLRDADGSAVIVHANPDNYANIPTDRYDPDPDRTTLDTGDAGARLACGVIR